MAIEAPKIDPRTFKDIIRQVLGDGEPRLEGLRDRYLTDDAGDPIWKTSSQDTDDPGIVLTMLFGKLMEIILERLNGIPEKHFVAFLDLLGVERLPGNSARTPVQFILPIKNTSGGSVSSGTQLVTGPTESGRAHVFETQEAFFVIPRLLKKIYSITPAKDQYSNLSSLANRKAEMDLPLLYEGEQMEHCLYIAHDTLLGFSEPVKVTIQTTPFLHSDANREVVWERYHLDEEGAGEWEKIEPQKETVLSHGVQTGHVEFADFRGTALSKQGRSEEGGGEARWIRARLNTKLTPGLPLPRVESLQLNVSINRSGVPFDEAYYNNVPIDLSKDFHPFGEGPKLADTFYMASNEAFSKPEATITLYARRSEDVTEIKPSAGLRLKWETWNGTTWVDVRNPQGSNTDLSAAEGDIVFTLPDKLGQKEVNGVTAYWVRVRIAKGNYGEAAKYVKETVDNQEQYVFYPDDYKPPVLGSLTLEYSIDYSSANPEKCLTMNSFVYKNQAGPLRNPGESFPPFERSQETEPSLYFGFDKPFGDKQISLFLHIVEDFSKDGSITGDFPQVVWEYSSGSDAWSRLENLEDSTNNLTTSGTIAFLGPDDFAEQEHFGQKLYWLRARVQSGSMPQSRLLKGVYLNTVWASNLTTVKEETLGSGNGKAGQSLEFSQNPVLLGEEIYVREPETPSEEAREALEAEERQLLGRALITAEKEALVKTVENSLTGEKEIWVRWHRVGNFLSSNAQDRHYTLDRVNGVLKFGDGKNGMVPPIGRNNIKAFCYQSGGGLAGSKEVKVGVIKELRSALPFVDSLTNVVDASGGSDPHSLEDALEHGPQTIKNRNRAVTFEDYEWLAKQASTLVHQVKCLPTRNDRLEFEPGSVALILIPDSDDAQPRPSQELIRTVKSYLQERSLSVIKPNIYIVQPQYQEVDVRAEVVATNPEESSVVEGRITKNLKTFLHPVKGGPDMEGWEFGRNVYISEIYQLIEDTEGVDMVLSVTLNQDPSKDEVEISDNEMCVSGEHEISMKAE